MKRLITGIVYMLILFGVLLLRHFLQVQFEGYYVHLLCFDALVVAFCIIGTFEMVRAVGDKIDKVQKGIVLFFAPAVVAAYAISDSIYRAVRESNFSVVNYSPNIAFIVYMAAVAVLFGLLVLRHEKTSLDSLGYSLLCLMYPSVFLLVLSGCNHMPRYSEIGLVFVFVICPCADSLAYVFGKLFGKKFPAKMAPNVSPNKTIVGGIGGVVGGALGAAAIFFFYYGLLSEELSMSAFNVIFFVALGILTALFTEFGDLVESAIKRRLGIKDMGKLLPGHGGILDRIDSTLYASLIVCFVVVIRILTTG